MSKIKILLIEDNLLLREGTTAMLNEQKGIQAESAVGNKRAFEKATRMRPDVILLDIGLKGPGILEALAAIEKELPKAEVIVMDLIPAHSEVTDLVKAGVVGFVFNDTTLDGFLNTIRSAVKGVGTLPPTMADSLFSRIVKNAIQTGTVDRVVEAVKLTIREQEVVRLLAEGVSTTEIARRLKVAVFTVKKHLRSIMDKLALHTRLELAAAARQSTI